jgi:hypothetical protein
MKIIITETQLEMLKLLKESENNIKNYKTRLNNITNQLNTTYTNINFFSIAELITGEIEINPIYLKVNELDSQNSKIYNEIEQYFKSFNGEDDKWSKVHDVLEDLYYKNSDKINILSTILIDLGNLVEGNTETKEVFSDIKSIDLY